MTELPARSSAPALDRTAALQRAGVRGAGCNGGHIFEVSHRHGRGPIRDLTVPELPSVVASPTNRVAIGYRDAREAVACANVDGVAYPGDLEWLAWFGAELPDTEGSRLIAAPTGHVLAAVEGARKCTAGGHLLDIAEV